MTFHMMDHGRQMKSLPESLQFQSTYFEFVYDIISSEPVVTQRLYHLHFSTDWQVPKVHVIFIEWIHLPL